MNPTPYYVNMKGAYEEIACFCPPVGCVADRL